MAVTGMLRLRTEKSLTIWCSRSVHGRKGEMTEGKKLPPSPNLPITVYCARDWAYVQMQRKGILPEDIYCSSFYVQCLILEHVKLLKKRGY